MNNKNKKKIDVILGVLAGLFFGGLIGGFLIPWISAIWILFFSLIGFVGTAVIQPDNLVQFRILFLVLGAIGTYACWATGIPHRASDWQKGEKFWFGFSNKQQAVIVSAAILFLLLPIAFWLLKWNLHFEVHFSLIMKTGATIGVLFGGVIGGLYVLNATPKWITNLIEKMDDVNPAIPALNELEAATSELIQTEKGLEEVVRQLDTETDELIFKKEGFEESVKELKLEKAIINALESKLNAMPSEQAELRLELEKKIQSSRKKFDEVLRKSKNLEEEVNIANSRANERLAKAKQIEMEKLAATKHHESAKAATERCLVELEQELEDDLERKKRAWNRGWPWFLMGGVVVVIICTLGAIDAGTSGVIVGLGLSVGIGIWCQAMIRTVLCCLNVLNPEWTKLSGPFPMFCRISKGLGSSICLVLLIVAARESYFGLNVLCIIAAANTGESIADYAGNRGLSDKKHEKIERFCKSNRWKHAAFAARPLRWAVNTDIQQVNQVSLDLCDYVLGETPSRTVRTDFKQRLVDLGISTAFKQELPFAKSLTNGVLLIVGTGIDDYAEFVAEPVYRKLFLLHMLKWAKTVQDMGKAS